MVLWKRKNTKLHSGTYQMRKIYLEINKYILRFIKLRFNMQIEGYNWINIVDALQDYMPYYQIKIFRWRPLPHDWMKGNTDGASRGNLGLSSCAFYIRNSKGNLIVAKGSRIHDTTSIVAEAMAIRECLRFCRDNNIQQIEVETDSWTLVQVLQGE